MAVKTILATFAVSLALTGAALAQAKIQVGCTATSDCASAMVAIDEGIFKKHGLEVEMTPIGINSNIPAAILSNSIQIGGPTSTVFLQAVDGGLDLVAIAGATVMSPVNQDSIAAFVRNGITIKEPKDFVGKKVGAPGLNAFLHVLFVKWLVDKGVDPRRVNFVEVTFPTMADIIKSGGVDAVLTAEPFVTRMLNAGLGSVGARYAAELARTEPIIFYAASREWADKNAVAIKKFRDAIAEICADRQWRSRKGLRVDLQIHQAADRIGQGDAPEPIRAGAQARAVELVDRGNVVAENAAIQARYRQTGPEVRLLQCRLPSAIRPNPRLRPQL